MFAQKNEGTRPVRFSYLGYLGIISLGATLVIVLFWQERRAELNNFHAQFERDAMLRANLVETHLKDCVLIVSALHSYYAGSQEISRDEFRAFTDALLADRKELQVIGWLPRISRSERKDFEERMRQSGFKDFKILDFVTEQTTVVAPEQEEYFPIEYMEPTSGNETKLGLNIFSQPIRRTALERAPRYGHAGRHGAHPYLWRQGSRIQHLRPQLSQGNARLDRRGAPRGARRVSDGRVPNGRRDRQADLENKTDRPPLRPHRPERRRPKGVCSTTGKRGFRRIRRGNRRFCRNRRSM